MTYKSEEERKTARRESRRRYYLKTRKLKGYPGSRPDLVKTKTGKESLVYAARRRAKLAGLEFSISVNDFEIPDICPITNQKLSKAIGKRNANSPSLDRIDNSKGYIPGNVACISWRANRLKWNGSLEEFKNLVTYMS